MKTVKNWVLFCALILLFSHSKALLANDFTLLHTFGTNADGGSPQGSLTLCNGTLYGVTQTGDQGIGYQFGTVYCIGTNGSNYTTLYSFSGPDGQFPVSSPIVAGGMIYGTTAQGGANLDGVIYSMCTNGNNFTVLHAFDEGSGGSHPWGNLLLVGDTLYGTTTYIGTNHVGSIFSINTNGSNYSLLASFTNLPSNGQNQAPVGQFVVSGSTLYGVTQIIGLDTNEVGVLYSVPTSGSNVTVLHQFTLADEVPSSLVISGNTLYCCTYGSLFSVGTDGGNFTKLYSFETNDIFAYSSLLTLSGNTLYGAGQGGTNNSGRLFSINTDGYGYQTLYDFSVFGEVTNNHTYTNADGINPSGPLFLCGSNLFGVTTIGGTDGSGTLFELTLTAPTNTPPQTNSYMPFFTGQYLLGDNWYYMGPQSPNTYGFGYYNMGAYPYVFHNDLGWEYCFDAANANHGIFFYDFTDDAFFYTEPGLFPYLFDFKANAWVFFAPVTGDIDRYQSNPRWFFNYSTGTWGNHL